MSVATKVAAFIVIIRLFDDAFASYYSHWSAVVIAVAILSMVVGNFAALTQTSIKRMLAYSGIAQAGYILIGVAVGVGTSLVSRAPSTTSPPTPSPTSVPSPWSR